MKSIDTNILFYATNQDCEEYEAANGFVTQALDRPEEWVIADQVYFELYRLLRNGVVLTTPLSSAEAAQVVDWYRSHSGWLRCAWQPDMMTTVDKHWRQHGFARRNTFDLKLATTLERNGVDLLYTRNTEDFAGFGLLETMNPID